MSKSTTFEHRAEERFEAVEVRLRAEVAAVIDQRVGEAGGRPAGVQGGETRRRGEKRGGDAFVLFGLEQVA